MSPAELYGKVILVDEFGLIVTICLYPSLLPIFKFSELHPHPYFFQEQIRQNMRIIDRKRQEFTIERIMIKLQTIKVCASSFGEGRCDWHFAAPQNISLTL